MRTFLGHCNEFHCSDLHMCSDCRAGDFHTISLPDEAFFGDLQSPPAATLRAGGESAAKLSPPPAAIDPSMKLKELRVLLHPNVLRLAKTAAAYDDVSMPVWIAQALKAYLERYPF